jgi:hypothetical protein
MKTKTSWRDHIAIHPAADVFPLLDKKELRALADDIRRHGLKEPVTTIIDSKTGKEVLLDGRNRLDALELLGSRLFEPDGSSVSAYFGSCILMGQDPVSYVISLNIKRRHLTKEQQVELIDKAIKAGKGKKAPSVNSTEKEGPRMALVASEEGAPLSRHPEKPGNKSSRQHGEMTQSRWIKGVRGSTKDAHKTQVIAEAAKVGISKRTVERTLSKSKTPARKKLSDAVDRYPNNPGPSWLDSPTRRKKFLDRMNKRYREALNSIPGIPDIDWTKDERIARSAYEQGYLDGSSDMRRGLPK